MCCKAATPCFRKGAPRGEYRFPGYDRWSCYRIPRSGLVLDEFSEHYQDLIVDRYDCVDRIVLNAYFLKGQYAGGMRVWWRALHGSDEDLDTSHLMRMAGRFARRRRGFARARGIPVVDCAPQDKKFERANAQLAKHDGRPGLFLILVGKARAPVWEVRQLNRARLAISIARIRCPS